MSEITGNAMAPRDVAADRTLLTEAVREAGAIALRYFGNEPRAWDKHPNDPVSEADLAVNQGLKARLLAARPHYGWLSEETEDDGERLKTRHVWIVDPIDGTRAFLQNKPEFAVSVALVEDGKPVLGAVYNPATEEFFDAVSGQGAALNGKAIFASKRKDFAGGRFLASPRTIARYRWREMAPNAEFAEVFSIAYRLAKVAAGMADAAISLAAKNDWDIAAADLVVREAGGLCTTKEGTGFLYNREIPRHPSVIATAPALHRQILDMLRAA
jgi:myo-inositol-1(or 4)-monophosphatase